TQKIENKEKTTQKATQKIENKEKTAQKIISLMKSTPYISREEIARLCEVTSDAIKLQIKKLKDTGKIRRIGPDKGGYWEVLE
ncbi:MAG: winged helix-turn-helix transcriptional regulator, partial [Muribaculaceae bacterium]|nr:winged helix-turn-helix transcriptional regulator [Muribaculaceae bacterium]